MADSQTENGDATLDIDAASARIGESLFGSEPVSVEGQGRPDSTVPEQSAPPAQTSQPTTGQELPTDLLSPPKSWRQDMHPHWGKMPKEAQQYYVEREKQMLDGMQQYKQIREVLSPFEQQLSQQGVSVYDWVRGLTQAERMLTQGTDEQRRAAYHKLGEQLGLATKPQTDTPAIDPTVRQIQEELAAIKSGLSAQQQSIYNETKTKVQSEVDAFAADTKAHPHFDEVAADDSPRGLTAFLRQGLSLQDAYDAAVWANPLVREKASQQRLTDELAKQKENARLAALPKKKAASVNVRSADSSRTPTEPVGLIEDTIKAKLHEIRQRA